MFHIWTLICNKRTWIFKHGKKKEELYHLAKMRQYYKERDYGQVLEQESILESKKLKLGSEHMKVLFQVYNQQKELSQLQSLLQQFKKLNKTEDWMYHSILRHQARFDNLEGMEAIWTEMTHHGCLPTMELVRTMISAYERAERLDRISLVLEQFPLLKITPDEDLWNYMLFTYARTDRFEEAEKMAQTIKNSGRVFSPTVLGVLIFLRQGDDRKLNDINIEVNQRGLTKDPRFFNVRLELMQGHNQMDEMLDLYKAMKKQKVPVLSDAYGSLLVGLARNHRQEVSQIWKEMIDSKKLSNRGASALMKEYTARGDYDAAEKVYAGMNQELVNSALHRNRAYLYGIQGETQQWEDFLDHIRQLNSSVLHVGLYNSYAAGLLKGGHQEAATEVLTSIKSMANEETQDLLLSQNLVDPAERSELQDRRAKARSSEFSLNSRKITEKDQARILPKPPKPQKNLRSQTRSNRPVPALYHKRSPKPILTVPGEKKSQKQQHEEMKLARNRKK